MTAGRTSEEGFRVASALRFVVSVAALYALVMASLLGTVAGASATVRDGILCQQQIGDPSDGVDHDPECCTAACVSSAFVPRIAAESGLAWPARPAIHLAWRNGTQPPVRGPPRTLANPRGPPAA